MALGPIIMTGPVPDVASERCERCEKEEGSTCRRGKRCRRCLDIRGNSLTPTRVGGAGGRKGLRLQLSTVEDSLLYGWPSQVNETAPPPGTADGASANLPFPCPMVTARPATTPTAAPKATSLRKWRFI